MKKCNQCGKCCIAYSDGGLSASESELEFWKLFRPDIYRYVNGGKIWADPESGEQLTVCPWLRHVPDQNRYYCDIYNDRPDDCKYFPTTVEEMVTHECEMLEDHDVKSPKRAQLLLDELMQDSRPPLVR